LSQSKITVLKILDADDVCANINITLIEKLDLRLEYFEIRVTADVAIGESFFVFSENRH